jgi:hypothetical protein
MGAPIAVCASRCARSYSMNSPTVIVPAFVAFARVSSKATGYQGMHTARTCPGMGHPFAVWASRRERSLSMNSPLVVVPAFLAFAGVSSRAPGYGSPATWSMGQNPNRAGGLRPEKKSGKNHFFLIQCMPMRHTMHFRERLQCDTDASPMQPNARPPMHELALGGRFSPPKGP